MDPALKRLMKQLPPPSDPTGRDVNWEASEKAIGLIYPTSFKEFIGVYGGSIWFDNLTLLYPQRNPFPDVSDFLKVVEKKIGLLVEYGILDEHYNRVSVPLYPDKGGLFPFLADYNGYEFFWQSKEKNSDKWRVFCWKMGPLVSLGTMTIAKMIVEFLERKPRMIDVWGDVNLYEPERIRVDRWVPPKPTKRRHK